jgi:DNA recombination protein RmuC
LARHLYTGCVSNPLIYILVFALAAGVGFFLMYRYCTSATKSERDLRKEAENQIKKLNEELRNADARAGKVEAIEDERDRLVAELRDVREEIKKYEAALAKSQEMAANLKQREEQLADDESRIRDAFTVLAKQVVDQNTEEFLKRAGEVLGNAAKQTEAKLDLQQKSFEGTLLPLKESLKRIDEQAQSLESARQKAFGEIAKGLENVVLTTQSVAKEAGGLKDALKKPHVRGRWGEAQLQNCMELAGMSEHCDLTFQDAFDAGDDGRLIPDMTVKMPGGRLIVVDAKTPREAFDEYIDAVDDDSRRTALLRHGRQVLSHVESLAKKDYGVRKDHSPDFVVMFLPNESFLYAALEGQPNLVEAALAKRILIASPPTLVGLLKVIRYGWMETRLADDAQKIAKEGALLHKRIGDLLTNFTKLGKGLDNAKEAFDTACYNLNSKVVVSAKRLESLGASNGKSVEPIGGALPVPSDDDLLSLDAELYAETEVLQL